MWEIVVIAVVVVIAAVLIFAATRPDSFAVERSTAIGAVPDKIFPLINDFKSWSAWSPYEKRDPAMKRTYSSQPAARARSTSGTATARSARAASRSSMPRRRRGSPSSST